MLQFRATRCNIGLHDAASCCLSLGPELRKKPQGCTVEKSGTLRAEDVTSQELTAALAYYGKLKPSCVDSGISYEERVARRKEDIASLQEA